MYDRNRRVFQFLTVLNLQVTLQTSVVCGAWQVPDASIHSISGTRVVTKGQCTVYPFVPISPKLWAQGFLLSPISCCYGSSFKGLKPH